MKINYRPFDLFIHPYGGAYRARVLPSSDSRGVSQDFELPDFGEKKRVLASNATHRDIERSRSLEPHSLQQVGGLLFESIFRGEIAEVFQVSRTLARKDRQGLRIQLRLADVPELAIWPWEALYDPGEGQFLAALPEISIVRFLGGPVHQDGPGLMGPLHILVVTANPKDELPLDVEKEWASMRSALCQPIKRQQIHLERLGQPTVACLLKRLSSGPCHILHFIGHGTFDEAKQAGFLLLENQDGGTDSLDTQRLGAALRRHSHIHMVFLNVCEGGKQSQEDPFSGLAQSLVRQGIPTVLAMGSSIRDDLATSFSAAFYKALGSSHCLEGSVAEARSRIFSELEHRSWATPIFFVRQEARLNFSPEIRSLRNRRWLQRGAMVALLGTATGLALMPALDQFPEPPPKSPFSDLDYRCPSPKGIDLELVYIGPGEFSMGEGDGDWTDLEYPFCLARTETTQETWGQDMENRTTDPSVYRSPSHPVHGLSWEEVLAFFDRLNALTEGEPFRVPSEAEWEYVARLGGKLDPDQELDSAWLESQANCLSKSGADGFDGVAPAASFLPNAWGLHDLHGNVWEWVLEPAAGQGAPRPLLRGGAYDSSQSNCRSTTKAKRSLVRRQRNQGFRIARDPLPE